MPQLPFPSPLPSIETYETQCLHNFFNENGNTSLFGLLIDKDGIIEYAIGSHIEDLLGLPIHHLLHRPFILLVSLQDRARICSLLPSSNSYRYGSTKRLQLDFICDKNSAKISRLEVSTKLIYIPSGMNSSQTEKTLVACVARRPSDDVPSGTFSLFLDRVNFRVVGFDGRNANIPFLTDTTFHGKTLQELCKRQEWPTIDLILETACHVQRSSTELTFSLVDGINLVTTVMTLSSKGSTGPIQLQCQIQRSFGTAGVTRSVSISDPAVPSTSNSIDLNANQMDKTAIPQLNRTISVPAQAHFFGPNSNSSTIGSCPDDRMDFVINSVVSNSESKPEGSMLRNLLNQAPSQYAPYTPTPTPKSSAGTVQNPPPSPFGYSSLLPVQIADMKIENSDMPETSEMPMPAKEPAKKKRVRNPAQKGPKMTKKQRELEKQAAEAAATTQQPHSQEMFQTAGYPAPPPGGPNGHYPGPPGVGGNPNANANAAMMMRGNGAGGPPQGMGPPHSQGQGGFNPNMPSSSRANPMTSTATAGYMQMNHPHSMGPPMGGPMGHPGYNHMAQMQQQQQQQQGGPMGGPSQMQHGPGPNQMGMPNQWQGMYQGPHPGQQMYGPQGGYPGQERPGFMPPHGMQAPPQQQPTQAPAPAKKPSKRKSNQQKHQEAVAAMQANTSNAAPPPKQAFLNPMGGPPVGFNGNSNFPGGAQPNQMGNHLSPYHPHSQHAQQAQMQAMHDWNRQHAMASAASANRAGANSNSRNEPAIRGDVRSKLHASIHSRQNASPQQMAAMMSPNDLAAAASGRYPPGSTGANAGNSISPPTMMSPPRINQVPQNPGHAASNYGPQSVPNPPSMPSEQNHHAQQQQGQGQQGHPMFSPKMQPPQGFYHQNGHSQMTNGFMGASGQGNHNGVVPGMTHLQNQNELPQVTLEDCKAILQETDFADFDSISFDMTNKQGFEFNYDESRTLLQRILS